MLQRLLNDMVKRVNNAYPFVKQEIFRMRQAIRLSPNVQPKKNESNLINRSSYKIEEEEAILIMGLKEGYTREDLDEKFEKMFEKNSPDKGGSFYIQSKIYRSNERLKEILREKENKNTKAE